MQQAELDMAAERHEKEINDVEAVLRTGVKLPKQKLNTQAIANPPHQGAEEANAPDDLH
jgi:hypothetical protein